MLNTCDSTKEGTNERTNERMYTMTKHITTLLLRSRVKNRMNQQLEENESDEQAGFRKNRSSADQIHINQLMEKAREYKLTLGIHAVYRFSKTI